MSPYLIPGLYKLRFSHMKVTNFKGEPVTVGSVPKKLKTKKS